MKLITEITEEIHIIKEGSGDAKSYFIEGIFLQGNLRNRNRRMYPIDILENEVNRYTAELIDKNRAYGELGHPECNFSSNFDVLTSKGWKPFLSLNVNEEILTFGENDTIETQPITHIINQPYTGHGYKIECRGMESSFTPNHRFYLKNRNGGTEVVTIEEIFNNRSKYNKHRIPKTGNWNGTSPDFIEIPGIPQNELPTSLNRFSEDVTQSLKIDTKTFVQFLGIYLAEGHITSDSYEVFLSQNQGETLDTIETMLEEFPLKWNKRFRPNEVGVILSVSDIRLWSYLEKLGNKYTKYIPLDIKQLASPYLEELVQWFIMGDGRTTGNRQNLFSVSKRLIEDLHECVIKSGGSGNWTEVHPSKDYMFAGHLIEAKNKVPLYQLNISTCSGIYLDERFVKITKVQHSGNVYCLRVKNGNFYMKENGKAFWTGNSPSINLERASHLIQKLQRENNNFVGKAKVLGTPYGNIVKNLLDEGAQLGVSSRGLGTLEERNGTNVVGSDFMLATAADIVADPSAPEAFVRGIMEDAEWVYLAGKGWTPRSVETIKKTIKKTSSKNLLDESVKAFKAFMNSL